MKILGITCGRPNGNCEILVKEALMAAEELGAKVELLRLNDFEIRPCTACNACSRPNPNGIDDCIWDDDFPTLAEHFLDADGVIIAVPIYIWRPAGNFRALTDRLGSRYDIPRLRSRGADGPDSTYDKRIFKTRPVAFITVGGTCDPRYASMGMGPMQQFQHSMRLPVVDRLMALESDLPGAVLIHDEYVEKAHRIGEEVYKNCFVPAEKMGYYGEKGTCPICHNDMMMVDEGAMTIKCPFCIVEGKIRVGEDGAITTDFSQSDLSRHRNAELEMLGHAHDINVQMADWFINERTWKPMADEYRRIDIPLIKPEKPLWKVRKR